MNNKLKPALIGGLVVGLLSAIPFVNWVNICCCLWAILGGLLGSYLYVKNAVTPARAGDGALVGILTGVIGAAIYLVIGIPLAILAGSAMMGVFAGLAESLDPNQAEQIRTQMEAAQTVAGAVVHGLITAVLLVIFSTLGGLLGVPIFERRKPEMVQPPPPQNFGGPGYGTGV
ncbi:MAG TPA: hypothetical protein VMM84_09075 [Pyrinomonadaceae bacterium]|nr:hypothetical protein [Pyrinomonadaceae bacterium]